MLLKVLSICRDVLGSSLGWDDVFADHGGHSIVIARLATQLRAAGWMVPVVALLTDCNTASKVARRSRERFRPSMPTRQRNFDNHRNERDASAAKVLSVSHFTTLQVLLLLVLYAPALLAGISLVAFAEIGDFFMDAQLGRFVIVGCVTYLLALAMPFAGLIWVMLIKLCIGGHPRHNNVTPGAYPKWSRMHLRVWYIERLQLWVLRPFNAMYRSPPLMAWLLRGLGATVGKDVHCAHGVVFAGPIDLLSVEDDVTIQTGAYLSMSRWVGQELHVGPVQLESGCKIGMRAGIADHVTVGTRQLDHPADTYPRQRRRTTRFGKDHPLDDSVGTRY